MAWKLDSPLTTLADSGMNDESIKVWEGESLGGIAEDNNRVPQAVVVLMVLTIITAFLITAPLWGHRPTSAIYAEYIELMDTPAVQQLASDEEKMKYMVDTVKNKGSEYASHQERHPLTMNDLRLIKPQIIELQRAGVRLEEYTVVGYQVPLSNFEGEMRADGTQKRTQPWWDKGYTIDVFYVLYFCIGVVLVVKRLPPNTWKPDHSKAH